MFSSSVNCARIPPAALLVDPLPRVSRSHSTTSVTPRSARWCAVLAPIAPPPMMTTDADSPFTVLWSESEWSAWEIWEDSRE